MIAEKIRAQFEQLERVAGRFDDQGVLGAAGEIQVRTAFFLAEIAAQLAELNELLEARLEAKPTERGDFSGRG